MHNIKYNIKKERLTIFDVDSVLKDDALSFIEQMREKYSEYPVFNRSIKSLYNEFCVHKFCYTLHILRDKTRNAGMQYPISKFLEFLYSVFGTISKLFIK